MIINKKGLSTVVTTLIIILFVLVAIGIIWVVIRGVIETGSEQIDIGTACPLIDLRVIGNKTCDGTSCVVTLERRAGGKDFEGVRLVVSNNVTSAVTDIDGNIDQLVTMDKTATPSVANPGKVIIAAYFRDTQNNIQLCPNSQEYNII